MKSLNLILLCVTLAFAESGDSVEIRTALITQRVVGGDANDRIPVLAINPDTGTIHAFFEGRGSPFSDFTTDFLKHYTSADDGLTWTEQDNPADFLGGERPMTPSVVITDEGANGKIFLFYTRVDNDVTDSAEIPVAEPKYPVMLTSTDDGATWSAETDLSASLDEDAHDWNNISWGPGPGRVLASGRLVVPYNVRYDADDSGTIAVLDEMFGRVAISDDQGATWTYAQFPQTATTKVSNEAALTVLANGDLLVSARTNGAETRRWWKSTDDGDSWTDDGTRHSVDVVHCGLETLPDGRVIISSPRTFSGGDWIRNDGWISVGDQGGANFTDTRRIYRDTFGYSNLVVDDANNRVIGIAEVRSLGADSVILFFSIPLNAL